MEINCQCEKCVKSDVCSQKERMILLKSKVADIYDNTTEFNFININLDCNKFVSTAFNPLYYKKEGER